MELRGLYTLEQEDFLTTSFSSCSFLSLIQRSCISSQQAVGKTLIVTLSLHTFATPVSHHSSMSLIFVIFIRRNVKEEKCVTIFLSLDLNFHSELCLHDKELLLGFACVHSDIYVCVCIYTVIALFLREKNLLQVIWILHGIELFLNL